MRAATASFLGAVALVAGCASAATAAPARATKLSPVEARWFKPLATAYGKLAAALSVVQKQELADGALVPGTNANHTLVDTLAVFVSCKPWLKQAGKPPTTRMQPFLTAMQSSCAQLYAGANSIARAIGAIGKSKRTLAVSLLKQGHSRLKAGSTLLAQAARQAIAVGGKAAFKA